MNAPSRFALGFAPSYSEVSRFERNAAVSKGIDIEDTGDVSFPQVGVVGYFLYIHTLTSN